MKYDLLLSGGEVVDPGSGLRGRMDVGIGAGKIVAVAPTPRSEDARRTISENRDLAIGVKLRYGPGIVWEYTTEPVKAARSAPIRRVCR